MYRNYNVINIYTSYIIQVCGTLIEIKDNRILIGIGCNVMKAPVIDTFGSNGGRSATCLAEHGPLPFRHPLSTTAASTTTTNSSTNKLNATTASTSSGSSSDGSDNERVVTTMESTTTELPNVNSSATTCTPSSPGIDESLCLSGTDPLATPSSTEWYNYYDQLCQELAYEITMTFKQWLDSQSSHAGVSRSTHTTGSSRDTSESVISDFERWMDRSPQVLRRDYAHRVKHPMITTDSSDTSHTSDTATQQQQQEEQKQSVKGETVLPLHINTDGTLEVQLVSTGATRTLIADYLW